MEEASADAQSFAFEDVDTYVSDLATKQQDAHTKVFFKVLCF